MSESLEKYSLFWKSYSDHLSNMLHEMFISEDQTDVTLVCDDKRQLKAHRVVLSACSSVFKSILSELAQSCSVIYLRGVQYQDLESILEFMYLGVATVNQGGIDEFISIGKNLEIKEISNNADFKNSYTKIDSKMYTDNNMCNNQTKPNEKSLKATQEDKKYDCDQCDFQTLIKSSLRMHIEAIHRGVRYKCDQCDFQAAQKGRLKQHRQSKHEGVQYSCDECNYKASRKDILKAHIESVHEGVKYPCNKCEFQATRKSKVNEHIKSIHDGIRYACHLCDYQSIKHGNLEKHIKNVHEVFL